MRYSDATRRHAMMRHAFLSYFRRLLLTMPLMPCYAFAAFSRFSLHAAAALSSDAF